MPETAAVVVEQQETLVFEDYLARYEEEYNPQSIPETELVRQIADAVWRLEHAARMEREMLEKYPNPFLDPQDPITQQFMRLNRYRNTIQRTYDRAYKELQVLIQGSDLRRKQTFSRLTETARAEVREEGEMDMATQEATAEAIRRANAALHARPPESARQVLACRNKTKPIPQKV